MYSKNVVTFILFNNHVFRCWWRYLVFPPIWTIMVIVIFSTLLCFFQKNFCCSFFRITLNNLLLNLHFLYLVWILCSRISKSLYCGRVNFIYLFFQILFQSLSTHSILVSMECLLSCEGECFLFHHAPWRLSKNSVDITM